MSINETASAELREALSALRHDAVAAPPEATFDVKLSRKSVLLPDGWLVGFLLSLASVASLTIIPSFVMFQYRFDASVYRDDGTQLNTYRYEDRNLQIVWLPFVLNGQSRRYGPDGPSARDIAEDAVIENFLRHFARDSAADLEPDNTAALLPRH